MIGKRELSGQQVASFLCNIPNHFTNHTFDKLWWTSVLNFTFKGNSDNMYEDNIPDYCEGVTDRLDLQTACDNDSPLADSQPEITELPSTWLNEEDDGYMLVDSVFTQTSDLVETPPPRCSVISDMMFRPPSLSNMCLWEVFEKYKQMRIPQSRTRKNDDESADDDITGSVLLFHPNHPKHLTHCLRLRSKIITPVLLGRSIPRRDKEECFDAYAASMLTLFKPWTMDASSPLKPSNVSWHDAFEEFINHINPRFKLIMDNMQAAYECKDAAHDYAALRRVRLNELCKDAIAGGYSVGEDSHEEDPFWILAMQTPDTLIDNNDSTDIDLIGYISERSKQDTLLSLQAATEAGFYDYSLTPTFSSSYLQ